MAVLAQTNWVWLAVYLLADHCGLIIYKLARGDLVYWIPRAGVPLSMLIRFGVKVITDFTGYACRLQSVLGFRPDTGHSLSSRMRKQQMCPCKWVALRQVCSFPQPAGAGRHLLLRQCAEERRLVVRRCRSLLTVLRRRDDRAWPCRRHEHICGQLLRLRQLHGRKLHRRQRHRCRLRFRAGISRHLTQATRPPTPQVPSCT
jgi:hypothetical protein